MPGISDDARRNRESWTKANAEYTDARASATWAEEEITWGVFDAPEDELGSLGDVDGLDVVELGCGTAYVSAWLAKRGARPVGVDVTPAQLATARRCQEETGIVFPLVEASAEDVPLAVRELRPRRLRVRRQHLVRPARWIPEAHRLLRPGGRLWFLRNSTISILCAPDDADGKPGETLRAPATRPRPAGVARRGSVSSGSCRTASSSGSSADAGFELCDLIELYAPDDAEDHAYYVAFSAEWSRKWPVEEIWVAKKPG